jgi:hypothetical protein
MTKKCFYFEKCKGQGNTVIGRKTHLKTIYCPFFRNKEEVVSSVDENEEVLPSTSGTSINHTRNKSNFSFKNIERPDQTYYDDNSNRTRTVFRSNDNLSDDSDDDVYSVHQTRNKSNVSGISTRMSDKSIERSYQASLDNISSSTSNRTAAIFRSNDNNLSDVDDSNNSGKFINTQKQM